MTAGPQSLGWQEGWAGANPGQVLVPKLAITGFLLYFLKRLILGQSPAKKGVKYSYSLSTTPSEQKTKETSSLERRVWRNAEKT